MLKILSWNIQNVGQVKLSKTFSATMKATGMGNNVLDYIVKVAMGDTFWWTAPYDKPADIFVIIEPVSSGIAVGDDVKGSAGPLAILDIVNAINTVAGGTPPPFKAVQPMLETSSIGHKETIGIIYNRKKLALHDYEVLKDNALNYISPRTPFMAEFKVLSGAPSVNYLKITGIHASPEKTAPATGGTGAPLPKNPQDPPVLYCRQLDDCSDITTAEVVIAHQEGSLVMGDFNCNSATVDSKGNTPFQPMVVNNNYTVALPPTTLTSMRTATYSSLSQIDYRKNAFDNILYLLPAGATFANADVFDLIHRNPKFAGATTKNKLKPIVKAYWVVSDHLPVWATLS